MRRPVIAGNWKMFKTQEETRAFFDDFESLIGQATHCDIVICPPFTALAAAHACARTTQIQVGAQDMHWEAKGAFTGEISAQMLLGLLACDYRAQRAAAVFRGNRRDGE